MRRMMRRPSTPSWVSPGPRVPMPPACRVKAAAVALGGGLAGARGADAPGLRGEGGAGPPPQAGQAVAQQGQLDLGLALEGVGILGEDVEDDGRAIDRRSPEELLQVVLLGRG